MDNSYSQFIQSVVTSTKSMFPDNKVIIGNSNGQEPINPYISLRVIRNTPVGSAYNDTQLSSDGMMSTRVNYEALVQFSFTSTDEEAAADLAYTFVQYINTPRTREVFRRNNLGKTNISSVRNVAYKRETVWTQYYNVDVTFVYATITRQEMTPITAVELTEEISGTVFVVPPNVVIP